MNRRKPELQEIDLATWPTVADTDSILPDAQCLKQGGMRSNGTCAASRLQLLRKPPASIAVGCIARFNTPSHRTAMVVCSATVF